MSPAADPRTTKAVQLCIQKKISAKEAIQRTNAPSTERNVQKRVKEEKQRLALEQATGSQSSGEDDDDNTTPAAMQTETNACRALVLLTNGDNRRDEGEGGDDELPTKAQRKPHKERYNSWNKRPSQTSAGHRDAARRKLTQDESFKAASTE
jgi:hypothetical protein